MLLSSPDCKKSIDLVTQNKTKQLLIFLSDVTVLGVRPLFFSVSPPASGSAPASQQISPQDKAHLKSFPLPFC